MRTPAELSVSISTRMLLRRHKRQLAKGLKLKRTKLQRRRPPKRPLRHLISMTSPDAYRAADIAGRGFVALERFAARLQALRGWQRFAACFVFGLFTVAAQAPVHLFAILLVTLPSVVWLLDGTDTPTRENWKPARAAAAIGWWFGFGYFLGSLYWIGKPSLWKLRCSAGCCRSR